MSNLELAGIAAGILAGVAAPIGVVVALYAAKYSKGAEDVSIKAARQADERRLRDVRPHVRFHVSWAPILESGIVEAIAQNAGGAVVSGYVMIRYGLFVYGGVLNLAAHRTERGLRIPRIGGPVEPNSQGELVSAIGQDVDGGWWDLLIDAPLPEVPPLPIGDPEYLAWAVDLAGLGFTVATPD